MTDHSVKHSTFTLERTYAATPAAVFAAWSDRDTKAKWFAAEDGRYSLDFRVGGTEAVHGGDGADLVARSEHHTSSPTTVSLTTVRFVRDGDGTRLVLTEQGTFLDDQEQPEWREQGTGDWLDALGRQVAQR
ncbi:SRPBCC family protein [Jiangella alkaliphila]|uniref:Uncharacterized conserved protein YndB, AHSA1/START domain n=1 Tax=Jiangella alkaliphila TaxID=419479 RepID=A0A1H2J7L0_9ACTN|nr:SRPBCC domain-containing protein [Jiangella alkaliphila]SDU52417.1 Uncharacterized conserved protein YndB, AHSA1/START domain [Jiangella alkaliphila]